MPDYKIITEAKDLKGKRVLLRLDLNLPIDKGVITNDFRIKKSLETIEYLKSQGAKIIIISHIGREKTESLKDVANYLQKEKNISLTLVQDIFSPEVKEIINNVMKEGDVVLFENLRQYDGEKDNDKDFVKHLASFGDIYVNEAFSVAHRDHASITGLPKLLPAYAGIHLDQEIRELSKAFDPPNPLLLIVGGAKFETKLPLIKKFSKIANVVFVGGALSNDIFRFYGFEVGKSLVSDTPLGEIEALVDTGRILAPADVVVENGDVRDPRNVSIDERIMDAGPKTLDVLSKLIGGAKLIIWNGPLGLYEDGFSTATDKVMQMVIDADAEAIVGGGDTALAASKFEATDEQVFISTGGGSMLDFLSDEKLVGVEALK